MVKATLEFNNANSGAPTTNAVANTLVEAAKNSSSFSLPVNALTVVATSMSFLKCIFFFQMYYIKEAMLLF